jgi:hypothetical protein
MALASSPRSFWSGTETLLEFLKQKQQPETQQQNLVSVSSSLNQPRYRCHAVQKQQGQPKPRSYSTATFRARSSYFGTAIHCHSASCDCDNNKRNIISIPAARTTRSAVSWAILQQSMNKKTALAFGKVSPSTQFVFVKRKRLRSGNSSGSHGTVAATSRRRRRYTAMKRLLVLVFLSLSLCCSFASATSMVMLALVAGVSLSSSSIIAAAATTPAFPPPPPSPPDRRKPAHTENADNDEYNQRRHNAGDNGDGNDENLTLLQLLETEIWDGAQWCHGSWADAGTGHACPPPLEHVVAPRGFVFAGDWKIVTQSSSSPATSSSLTSSSQPVTVERDEYGWQYENNAASSQRPLRKRTWLRAMMAVPSSTATMEAVVKKKKNMARVKKTKISTTTVVSRHRPSRPPSTVGRWIQSCTTTIAEDYNFKGFGWAAYQSLSSRTFTLTLRCPLTSNFDCFDRNPSLPSISSTVSMWGSCASDVTVAFFLSGSMRIESIHWAATRFVELIRWMIVGVVHTLMSFVNTLIRGLRLGFHALVIFPFTRTWPEHQRPIKVDSLLQSSSSSGPSYSRDVEERLGFSLSWRYAIAKRRYEFRVTYWHWYAPTLCFLWQTWSEILDQILMTMTRKSSGSSASLLPTDDEDQMKKRRLERLLQRQPRWFARRSAAVGLSTSAPILDEPYVTTSLALSLSGYYFTPTLATTASASSTARPSDNKVKVDKGAIAAILAASEHKNKKKNEEEGDNDDVETFSAQNKTTSSTRMKSKSAVVTISNDDSDDSEDDYEEEAEDARTANSDELVKKKVANPQLEAEKLEEE